MYCSWYILGCHWDVCIVAGVAVTVYILGCHWDVCIVAGIYWAVTGMYVL